MSFKYSELSSILIEKIRNGNYPVGSRLPTEDELSALYKVSRQTVRSALSLLVEKGMVEKKQGSGNKVLNKGPGLVNRSIAIVASHTDDYIFPSILQEAQTVLLQNGYSSHIYTTHNKLGQERTALQQILNQSYTGVLVEGVKTSLPNPNIDLYQRLKKNQIPLVFFHGGYPELENTLCVSDESYNGAYFLTRYLVSKGHTNIGGVFKSDDIRGIHRYRGYTAALTDAGLQIPEEKLLWFSSEDRNSILTFHDLSLLQHYVKSRLSGCTALVSYNDEIAYYLVLVLQAAGFDIPTSISVVSFDNSYYCRLSPVPLSSLSQTSEQPAIVAANQLLRLINGYDAHSTLIPWKFIERQSS